MGQQKSLWIDSTLTKIIANNGSRIDLFLEFFKIFNKLNIHTIN